MTENLEKSKKGSIVPIVIVSIFVLIIGNFWNSLPFIKNPVHSALDPSVGALLKWNLTIGMMIIVLLISLITTLIQKYTTDQKALKELKEEQKIFQQEMKKIEKDPIKMAESSKKNMEFMKRTFKLTSRTILFTGIPFVLFFGWFRDVFTAMGNPMFFGFLSWFWFYFIFTIVFSGFLRKWMKVV
jgi:uncharacterized membrane protein (DUF106 family)